MKVTGVERLLLEVPHGEPHRKAWSLGIERARSLTLVMLRADTGATGYGIGGGDSRTRVDRTATSLTGLPVADLESALPRIHQQQAWAVDMAVCDLIGKHAGEPLHQLWAQRRPQPQPSRDAQPPRDAEPPRGPLITGRSFLPMVAQVSIPQTLSLVRAESRAWQRLADALYMSFVEMEDLDFRRHLHRSQIELVAARTSFLNNCFY